MSGEVEELLDDLRGSGRQVDGEADFSINPEKLAPRYATFQQANPAYCLLRLFQGLFRAGASQVDFTVARQTITVTAAGLPSLECAPWQEPEVMLSLLNKPQTWDRVISHLCVALLSASAENVARCRWQYGGKALDISGQRFEIRSAPGSDLRIVLEKGNSSKRKSLLSATSVEHTELVLRLAHASIPALLDKQKVQTLGAFRPQDKAESWYAGLSKGLFLGHAQGGSESSACGSCFEFTPHFARHRWPELPPEAQLVLELDLESHGELYPLIDGVRGNTIKVPTMPGLRAVWPVSDEEGLDLSGLSLRRNEAFVTRVRPHYKRLLRVSLERVPGIQAEWGRRVPKPFEWLGVTCMCSPEGWLVAPLLAGVVGVYLGGDGLVHLARKGARSERLREEVRERVSRILENDK